MPGTTRSHAAERATSADAQARSVIGLIEELGLDRPVLGGHDIGSRIALAVARRRPDRWYRVGSGGLARVAAETVPRPAERITLPTTVLWPEHDPLFPNCRVLTTAMATTPA